MVKYRTDDYGYRIEKQRRYGLLGFILDILCVLIGLAIGIVLFIVVMNALGHSVVGVNFIDRYL